MSKQAIRVSADSTCDLSPELLNKYGIETLPLYAVLEGKAYKDSLEITPDEIYAKVKDKEAKQEILNGMNNIIKPKSYAN